MGARVTYAHVWACRQIPSIPVGLPTPLDHARTLYTTTIQISDEVDHCYWGPPENLDARLRRSYKVTCENPGSQPGTAISIAHTRRPRAVPSIVPHPHTHTHDTHTPPPINPFKPAVMNTAAALAAGSIAFQDADPGFAHRMLEHAEQLYSFGERCPGDYIKDGECVVVG